MSSPFVEPYLVNEDGTSVFPRSSETGDVKVRFIVGYCSCGRPLGDSLYHQLAEDRFKQMVRSVDPNYDDNLLSALDVHNYNAILPTKMCCLAKLRFGTVRVPTDINKHKILDFHSADSLGLGIDRFRSSGDKPPHSSGYDTTTGDSLKWKELPYTLEQLKEI